MSRWGKIKNTESNFDPDFRFLLEIDPAFCHWQPLASEWWGQQTKWLQTKRAALTTLFIDYIHGQNLNKHDIICDFLDWALREKLPGLAEQCGDFKACDLRHPFKRLLPKKRVRKFDPEFNFLLQLDPAFDEWRAYGEEWISQQVTDVVEKM